MKISIITATKNSEATVAKTFYSINKQTYRNLEMVVVDGNSDDSTKKIIDEICKVDQYIIEKQSGVYYALNEGIRKSKGEIISILHSDDEYYSESVLNDVVKKFLDTNADIVYGNLIYVDKLTGEKKRDWKSGAYNIKKINYGWMPPHPAVFVRKCIYEKYGLFDTYLKISSDYDFLIRVMKKKDIKIEYLNKYLISMKTGGISNNKYNNIKKKNKEDYMVIKNNNIYFPKIVLLLKKIQKINQYFFRK
jgi:glycosyltransferase